METSLATEFIAGLSVYLSLAYIFIVNPAILEQAGIPVGAVFFPLCSSPGLQQFVWACFHLCPLPRHRGLNQMVSSPLLLL